MKQFRNLFKMFYLPSPEYPVKATNTILADFRLHSNHLFVKFYTFSLDRP